VTGGLGRATARERTLELLDEVGIHRAGEVYHQYPFELSGGMLQRVVLAIAISLNPELLVADEATTALDTVVQAEVLALLRRLRRTHGLSLLLVTHDLAVVAETCDRVLVMYAGEIVESGPTEQVLGDPQHPYTRALMGVASVGDWSRRTLDTIPGQPPAAGERLPGCRFAPRCTYAGDACVAGAVPLRALTGDREARCVRVAVPA
jgi:peptide/nickel transport system ATP-binding protein